jgi:hypothetical protein
MSIRNHRPEDDPNSMLTRRVTDITKTDAAMRVKKLITSPCSTGQRFVDDNGGGSGIWIHETGGGGASTCFVIVDRFFGQLCPNI